MTILIKPIITEKSFQDAGRGVFTFFVDKKATKKMIEKEVEKIFKVHVKKVTKATRHGKVKRVGRLRKPLRQPDKKIARLTLAPGEKIDFFEIGAKQ